MHSGGGARPYHFRGLGNTSAVRGRGYQVPGLTRADANSRCSFNPDPVKGEGRGTERWCRPRPSLRGRGRGNVPERGPFRSLLSGLHSEECLSELKPECSRSQTERLTTSRWLRLAVTPAVRASRRTSSRLHSQESPEPEPFWLARFGVSSSPPSCATVGSFPDRGVAPSSAPRAPSYALESGSCGLKIGGGCRLCGCDCCCFTPARSTNLAHG
jgi:hypothetical protein